jgi:hypothetical protein
MNPNPELFDYQLKAIRDIQENGLPVGRTNVLCSLLGRSQPSGKTNVLQHYIHSLPKEERDAFLASVRIIGPMGDAFDSRERLEETMRLAEERIQKSMTVMVASDVHVAISGGGQVPPRPIDLQALAGQTIHVDYYARGGWPSKNATDCAERPNTTDMFRMFRDNHNKPKRGKK